VANTPLYGVADLASSAGPRGVSACTEEDDSGPCLVVALEGRGDIGNCEWLRLLLDLRATEGSGRLVIDLSRVSSIDWWVALILTWVGRVISRRGGAMVLACPQSSVARVLNAAGVPRAVAVCDSLKQACDEMQTCPPHPTRPRGPVESRAKAPESRPGQRGQNTVQSGRRPSTTIAQPPAGRAHRTSAG
jgi:anti-anti-sigma factor